MRRLTPRAASWQLALGLEAGAALVGGLAGHGSIELRAGREASHWKMRIAFSGESARQLELLPGKVDWQHTSAGLSLAWHTLAPGWFLALDAGAVLGWASLAGHGYDSSAQQHSFEYGLSTGLRAGYQLGRWAFWLEGRPNFWLRGQRAVLTGESTTRDLPGTDMWLGAGLSAVLFP